METDALEGAGLTKNEEKIYVALLQLGLSAPAQLMHATGLHRSRVYDGLHRLMDKGLASSVRTGRQMSFQAMDADKLLDCLDKQKKEIEGRREKLQKALPHLRRMSAGQPKAEAQVLVGVEGFKAMRRDVLRNANGEHLLIGAIAREDEVMPDFFNWWNKQRKVQRIGMRILHKQSAKNKPMTKMELAQTRFLPTGIEDPVVINIYGDRVVDVLWKRNEPICFMLINKDVADAYRMYFELLWKTSKDVK